MQSPVREFRQISRVKLDRRVRIFAEAIRELEGLHRDEMDDQVDPEELADALEHIGNRLRDDVGKAEDRMNALYALRILTVATTRH